MSLEAQPRAMHAFRLCWRLHGFTMACNSDTEPRKTRKTSSPRTRRKTGGPVELTCNYYKGQQCTWRPARTSKVLALPFERSVGPLCLWHSASAAHLCEDLIELPETDGRTCSAEPARHRAILLENRFSPPLERMRLDTSPFYGSTGWRRRPPCRDTAPAAAVTPNG